MRVLAGVCVCVLRGDGGMLSGFIQQEGMHWGGTAPSSARGTDSAEINKVVSHLHIDNMVVGCTAPS